MGSQAIILIIDAAMALLTRAAEFRDRLKQDRELTPEEEAALDKKLADGFASARWQVKD